MSYIKRIYSVCSGYANSKYSLYILFLVAFSESSFFLVPPDVLLLPMMFFAPQKAWLFAAITTLASVLGGIFGYGIGYLAYDWILEDLIINFGYQDKLESFINIYDQYHVYAIFVAGFSPIPYKIATIASGMLGTNLFSFTFVSLLSRGLRFFLLALFVTIFHKKGKKIIIKYFSIITIILSVIILFLIIFYFFWMH